MRSKVFREWGYNPKELIYKQKLHSFHLDFSKAILIKYFPGMMSCDLFLLAEVCLFDEPK